MTAPNHFQVNRKLLHHPLWLAEPFTKGQAWVDMIGQAAHAPYRVEIRGIWIDLVRGQLALSEREYAVRWKWSRGKVRRFLAELERETVQQIVQQKTNVTSVVTIRNYNHYQLDGTANGTTDDTTDDTTDGPQTDLYNKIKDLEEELRKKEEENTRLAALVAEVKKSEGKEKPEDVDPKVLAIYKEYPRQEGRKVALVAIAKALKEVSHSELLSKVKLYAISVAGIDKTKIPHPTTWFNQGRWDDDASMWAKIGRDHNRQSDDGCMPEDELKSLYKDVTPTRDGR